MNNNLSEKILKENYKPISFVPKTPEFGLASFKICPVIRRGKIKEIYIFPRLQPDAEFYYLFKSDYGLEGLLWGTYLNKDKTISQPIIWKMAYCKKHKSPSFLMYPPTGSSSFFITINLNCILFNWV